MPGQKLELRIHDGTEEVYRRLTLTSSLRIGLVDDAVHIGMRTHL